MSNELKKAVAAYEIAIEANAAVMALYKLVGDKVEIDHEEFMRLREENIAMLKTNLKI
ncbi:MULTISPECIES: hypothetical protein [Lysinibacillus]|uniref:hypothetical protein n=1 Tax=Lysinibacillus TaxID=400634 RepID=UPI000A74C410|nr:MULTISPECIES: hypothetical protein [Lysinibacillus]